MIPLHKVLIAEDAIEKMRPTLHSGMITEADRVREFESRLGAYFGTQVLAVNSCTSAISLALHLCGVDSESEVISTPMTCAATNVHVAIRGAKLVWADVDPATGLIDIDDAVSKITSKTKAAIVTDWGGRPVDCEKLSNCVPVIQDAAHSFGATIEGRPAHSEPGKSADYVAWSFQAIKHLTTGDGGALKVPPEQVERARKLRWFGIDREAKVKFRFLQDIQEAGYKYHMNDLVASLGLANLNAAIESVDKHRSNAGYLLNALAGSKNVELPQPNSGSSWWFFSLLMENWESFVDFAAQHGVGAGPVHGRNDAYSAFGKSNRPLPGVYYYSRRHVAIPCGWWLSKDDLDKIVEVVIKWDKSL